jgi:hypothetical protein
MRRGVAIFLVGELQLNWSYSELSVAANQVSRAIWDEANGVVAAFYLVIGCFSLFGVPQTRKAAGFKRFLYQRC